MGLIRYYIFSRELHGKTHYDIRYESSVVIPSVCEETIRILHGTTLHQGLFDLKRNINYLATLERVVREANEGGYLDLSTLDKVA